MCVDSPSSLSTRHNSWTKTVPRCVSRYETNPIKYKSTINLRKQFYIIICEYPPSYVLKHCKVSRMYGSLSIIAGREIGVASVCIRIPVTSESPLQAATMNTLALPRSVSFMATRLTSISWKLYDPSAAKIVWFVLPCDRTTMTTHSYFLKSFFLTIWKNLK